MSQCSWTSEDVAPDAPRARRRPGRRRLEAARVRGGPRRRGHRFAPFVANRLIGLHGSARTMLVNYLLPGFALVYGVAPLDEPLTAAKLGGLALILAA